MSGFLPEASSAASKVQRRLAEGKRERKKGNAGERKKEEKKGNACGVVCGISCSLNLADHTGGLRLANSHELHLT